MNKNTCLSLTHTKPINHSCNINLPQTGKVLLKKSPDGSIDGKYEVSVDDGKTWHNAEFDKDSGIIKWVS